MTEKLILNLEILTTKADIKGIFTAKHWEEKVINHIFQSNGELTDEKEERVKRGAPTAHQMSKAFNVPEPLRFLEITTDFKIPACYKQLTNSLSESSLSTQLHQPIIFPETKSKR